MSGVSNSVVEGILKRYQPKRETLLPILHEVNDTHGYISKDAMQEIADFLNISPTEVYGTATFYSFLNIKPKGKYVIRLCQSISCHLSGKDDVVRALENELGISMGETTQDKLFTLEYTNCMGMCDMGPAMLVNTDVHTKLNPASVQKVVSDLKEESARNG